MGLIELPDGRWGHDDEPTHCPNGHPLGPRQVYVSYEHSKGRVYECARCGVETCRNPGGRYIYHPG